MDLDRFKNEYIYKMNFIVWEASQWMQYTNYTWDEASDVITLWFKTSSYGIGFNITTKAFSSLYGKPFLKYDDTYEYFKNIKYNECTRINIT